MSSPRVEKVINHLFQPVEDQSPRQVFAILDAARNDVIYPKVLKASVPSVCLHRGEKGRELAWVAPYLVELPREDPFTEWLLENGWGKSWGIFLDSPAPFRELREHFRSFLTVYDEDGKPLLFRYYDPRVFRVYLPTCNQSELKTVFGPVKRFCVEAEEHNAIIDYFLLAGELSEHVTQLGT